VTLLNPVPALYFITFARIVSRSQGKPKLVFKNLGIENCTEDSFNYLLIGELKKLKFITGIRKKFALGMANVY
jgi:hypothetical protein